MKKTILLSMMLAGWCAASAQELKHEVAATLGGGMHSLRYDVLGGDNTAGFGFRTGLGYTFFFNDQWGIGTGVEFARYNNRVALPDGLAYTTPFPEVFEPGSTSEYIVRTTGFAEEQKLSMLQIPLTVQFNAPAGRNVRFYATAGGKVGLPVKATWSHSAANVTTSLLNTLTGGDGASWTIEGVSRDNHTASGDLDLKTAMMLTAELGAKFRLSPKMWLYAGAYVDYGLNDVRSGTTNEANLYHEIYVRNNPEPATSNSILAMASATSGARPVAFGLNLRLGLGWGERKPAPVVVLPPPPPPAPAPAPEPEPEPVVLPPPPPPVVEVPQEIKKVMMDLSNTLFAFDRFNLTDEAVAELNKVAAWLNDNPELHVEISGHTDSEGTDDYNLRLSEERARSVHDYFTANGVNAARLSYRGYGESEPIADNSNPKGRQQSRRVELKIKN